MALIPVARFWTIDAGSTGTIGNSRWFYTGLDFNTNTHLIEPASGQRFFGILDPNPTNLQLPVGTLIWFECAADFTRTNWHYAGGSDTTVTTEADSYACGFLPPPPPAVICTLLLAATVAGDVITASVAGARGVVRYSIDGGTTRQASGVFADLLPGAYVVSAYDAGATNCTRSTTVFVVATPPGLAPVPGALPPVAFVGNPIALVGTATRPGRALLLELFVETAHGSRDYRRLLQRLRPTGADGRTVLELQRELAAALVPDRPDLARSGGLRRLTAGIRRYYAALAEILPATGAPGPFAFEPPATVLLGGLSWPAARPATFFNPGRAKFLTWRPELVQEVGPDHVLLHTALVPATVTTCSAEVSCYEAGQATPLQVLVYPLLLEPDRTAGAVAGAVFGAVNGSLEDRVEGSSLDPPTPYLIEAQVPVAALPVGTSRVTLRLVDQKENPLTEVRVFRIDHGKRRRQFLFLNSLGCFDQLSCYGPRGGRTSVERTVATTLAAPDYDPQDGTEDVVAVTADERISVSTGLVSPDELHWLRELHTSREVYEVVGKQLRKVRLTTKEFANHQDDAGADGYTFEYQYCFDALPYAPYDWI